MTKDTKMEEDKMFELFDKYRDQWNEWDGDSVSWTNFEKAVNEALILHNVSKSVAKQYAEFCVRCDREGLPLLELDDYIKQYCC